MPRDSGDDAYAEMARMDAEREEAERRKQREAKWADEREKKREKEILQRRLDVTRQEAMFEEHLRKVFGDRHAEFSKTLRDSLRELWKLALHTEVPTWREITAREEEQLVTGQARQTYPATVGKWSPDHGPSSERDVTRPPCPSCGGRGMGDYPYACDTCGGSGNA